MKKTVVNFYGGPGTGKSTRAAALFCELKSQGVDCELVTEYVKGWVWDHRTMIEGDQVLFCAKQSRAIRVLMGKVDVIITDSPVWLAEVYETLYENSPKACEAIAQKHDFIVDSCGYIQINVLIDRNVPYRDNGRFESHEEALRVDKRLELRLKGMSYLKNPTTKEIIDSLC